jgi:predicted acetyltransferase
VIDGLAIDPATAAEQPVIENLVQLYIHDFSELFVGTARGDLSDDGRYKVDIPLADWWQRPDHVPLLIRYRGRLAGFALLNTSPHGGEPVDFNMAEFFIVRKYRRLGIGTAAAHAIFAFYPGRWEAAVMRGNASAREFWAACIAGHAQTITMIADDLADTRWDGTLFRFEVKSPPDA